jgi:iron complex outermembrane recepter protein
MNMLTKKRHRSVALRLTPIAAGCAVMLSMASGAVYAQAESATPATSTVTVTGIRKGIEDAISVKKNSSSIVEAISAEDIGKLPDISIAESLARLPGLAAQRVAGRAQVISVRGLSPDFSTTLLNGREQVSTGDNRSVEFDQYPSELLGSVVVYKTPDAALTGQGLSGTIDLQTVRPLAFAKSTFSVNLRGEKNSLGSIADAKSTGNRFSVSYIDQFANRTIGLAIGYAHLTSPVLENQVGLYEPWKQDSRAGLPAGTFVSDGIKSLAKSGKRERDGVFAVVEWKPTKEWSSTLDGYYSESKNREIFSQFEANLGDYNGGFQPGLLYTQRTINSNNVLTGGVATGLYPLVRGFSNVRDDKIQAAGWNNVVKFKGFSLLGDISYSKAERNETNLETNALLRTPTGGPLLDQLTLNYATGGFPTLTPGRDYSNAANLFVGNTIYGGGYGKSPNTVDKLNGYKLVGNIETDAFLGGFFPSVDIGIHYSDRSKAKRQPENPLSVSAPGGFSTISSDLLTKPVNLGFSNTGIIPSWNVLGVIGKYFAPYAPDELQNFKQANRWRVEEKITSYFAKANIESDLGGNVNLSGNIGLQLQNTDQSSSANVIAGSSIRPYSNGSSYNDYLPSLNLKFVFPGDVSVRAAAAKQLARARVDQLRASTEFGIGQVTRIPGGSGGNPELAPWRANAFDLSIEKYFGTKAYVSAAFFYKDLRSYIFNQSRTFDFTNVIAAADVRNADGTPLIPITPFGTFSQPLNGKGGSLRGLELSASIPFNLFTPVLDGFGVSASGTFSKSSINIPDDGSNTGSAQIPLPGLSKTQTNVTFYYEKYGFSTRISQRQRSDFIGEIGNFAGNRTLRYVVGEKVVDFQIGYEFQEGTLKGLGFQLQANNLTNEAYRTYASSKDRPYEYAKYGRSFLFGANYKY